MVNVSSETPQHLSVHMGVQCINGYICTCEYYEITLTGLAPGKGGGGGGSLLPIMDYIGRLRPKGVSLSGWRYIKLKGGDFTS